MEGRALEYDSLSRVCVRAPNWVGDVVMATPALRAVREHFPGARVTLVVRKGVERILHGAPWFNDCLLYAPGGLGTAAEFFRCVGALRRDPCELALVLPNSFSSALMLRLAGARRRVGYARDCRSVLLTDALLRPSREGRFLPTYMVDYYLALCEAVGVRTERRDMELPFSDSDAASADEVLAGRGIGPSEPLMLLHPGAAYGPAKRWPAGRFGRLAERLEDECGARLAVIGGPGEAGTAGEVIAASHARIADLTSCGIDLHLLKCVVARSRLLVTTDSGPRHYGVALGVPTVCLMGPTHPGYSTSALPHDHVVRLDVPCGPCQKRACPLDHRCMEGITVEAAMAACRAALSPPSSGQRDD